MVNTFYNQNAILDSKSKKWLKSMNMQICNPYMIINYGLEWLFSYNKTTMSKQVFNVKTVIHENYVFQKSSRSAITFLIMYVNDKWIIATNIYASRSFKLKGISKIALIFLPKPYDTILRMHQNHSPKVEIESIILFHKISQLYITFMSCYS